MNSAICNAISRRAVISFYYHGGLRTVEPHCHGVTGAGNEVLRAYQTGGYSESGNPVGWKLYEVADMRNIQITEETFAQNRPRYNPNDRSMQVVHCHV